MQQLIDHINKRIKLPDEELAMFLAAFKPKRVKKRQFIVQPDFVARYRNYVVEGAFRAYVICYQGQEHTIQFAIEDWWISDYNSYIFQQPGTMFVVALENSTILQINFEEEQRLKREYPNIAAFFRINAERSTAALQRRIISNLTLSAEGRYEQFLERYPEIAHRVPQYALASFLGMSAEFLSKLRNKWTPKKS